MATLTSTTNLALRICGNLLHCRKNLSLYPEGHPRVLEVVEAIKADLTLHFQATGRPFAIETSTTLEESARSGRRKEETDDVTVGRLLKLHLISSATLLPEATSDELIPFCFLLEEDVAKASKEGLWDKINPDDWDHIRLSFYTPADFPDEIPTAETSLKRSAGIRRIKDVEALFSNLPESVRERVQKALVEPAFLQKFADLRRSFRQRLPTSTKAEGKKIDLFGEVLRSVLSSSQLADAPQSSAEEVIAKIHGVVGFFEENVDALAISVKTHPDGPDPTTVGMQLQEALRVGTGLSGLANAVQVQKQRLAFLFHTSTQSSPIQVQDEGRDAVHGHADQNKPTLHSHGGKDSQEAGAATLESQLQHVVYDLGTFENLLKTTDPYDNYVQIVLELLTQDECKENVSKLWPFISATLLNAPHDRLENALGSVCDFRSCAGDAAAEDFLVEVLYRASPPNFVLRILEGIVSPRGGPRLAATCLIRLSEKDPAGTLPLLCLIHSESKGALQGIAEARLIRLATESDLLLEWALKCPEGLLRPQVLKKVLGHLKREQVLRSFKLFFARAPELQATRILNEFPVGISGGADILFAALEKAPAAIQKVAIANLFKCPTPSVIATLAEIVKGNNYKKSPDMEEVEAALKSLLAINDPQAIQFLNEVLRKRRGFRRSYRKEIRRAVESLRSKG